jgi:uncharacterized protein with PIN domain
MLLAKLSSVGLKSCIGRNGAVAWRTVCWSWENAPRLTRRLTGSRVIVTMDHLIRLAEIEIVPVTVEQARLARAAYRDFGRGSGHPAKLNFGDCFSYALAKEAGEIPLYKGMTSASRMSGACGTDAIRLGG